MKMAASALEFDEQQKFADNANADDINKQGEKGTR